MVRCSHVNAKSVVDLDEVSRCFSTNRSNVLKRAKHCVAMVSNTREIFEDFLSTVPPFSLTLSANESVPSSTNTTHPKVDCDQRDGSSSCIDSSLIRNRSIRIPSFDVDIFNRN